MHILDIVHNSIKAKSKKIEIVVEENTSSNFLSIKVCDNGIGMTKGFLETIMNPFKKDGESQRVGLGIPMLKHTCEMCNGYIKIESEPERGTTVFAVLEYNNIDTPPMGDIAEVMNVLISANPDINFKYKHIYNGKGYLFDEEKIKGILGEVEINEPDVGFWIKENISEGIKQLRYQ